ncbi:MAG: rRNA maturation RNAse YbeY [Phycisphaerales bacterium]|nr:rRNA maturation RNAse YbeY [Phycisphaerales bacterium]
MSWRPIRSWRAVPLLESVARFVAAEEGFRAGELSVVVLGRRAMATLHETSLAVAGATDVLTFDLGTDRRAGWLEGEIYICADVALQQSRNHRRPAGGAAPPGTAGGIRAADRAELALYLVHGLLHLSGHEDHTRAGFARMHAREDELLRRMGHGSVFGDGERGRGR